MLRVYFPNSSPIVFFALYLFTFTTSVQAAPQPGYYDSTEGLTGTDLEAALHDIIDDHQRFPYTSTATDTWDILTITEEDPNNTANVLTIYRNASVPASDHSQSSGWNREHTWPSSYGFTNDGSCNYPYSDVHHLRGANPSYNTSRGNRVYDWCLSGCTEYPAENLPLSNWGSGAGNSGAWQVREDRRGDIARSMFYMHVRYEGGTHGATGCAEPDLILTDNRALIVSDSSSNQSVAYMGALSTLIDWHQSDPVDDAERARNDIVDGLQGNRNPFVDHPEFVCEVFLCSNVDTTEPVAPRGLVALPGDCQVALSWPPNDEVDLAGYHVYRWTVTGGPYTRLTEELLLDSNHIDDTAVNATTYFYTATASDTSGNESAASVERSGTTSGVGSCGGQPASAPWINELHYDNSGRDRSEGIEIAGPAGTDLDGWQLVPYNGQNEAPYRARDLTGTLPDQSDGFGTLWFPISRLQNGSPDGVALIDPQGIVIAFLSYEGSLTATTGAASGITSIDIGVSEARSNPVGNSLQLVGGGARYADFSWQAPTTASPGMPNAGQTFTGGRDTTAPAAPSGLTAVPGDASVTLDWVDSTEGDLAGYDVLRGTSVTGPYAQVNTALLLSSDYSDFGVTNGVTYFYIVRAIDTTGNVSDNSVEASTIPQDTTAPAVPVNLSATAADGRIDLNWADNGATDLAGYRVYRSPSVDGPYEGVNVTPLTVSQYTDVALTNGSVYFYVVTALDTAGNESSQSTGASATPRDTTPPAAPVGLVATGGDTVISLDWTEGPEEDLKGYNVYRATASGGPYDPVHAAALSTSSFTDELLTNGATYFYVVTAVDRSGNESADSSEATATPIAPSVGDAWINELHYDNEGADVAEGIEVAGTAGLDLTGWSLALYNGSGGGVYRTLALTGVLPDQGEGIGTLWFAIAGLQNGSSDGLALVHPTGEVLEFSSYEGTLTAVGGPASGQLSADIGVSEGTSTSLGSSLQLAGAAVARSSFAWEAPAPATPGLPNRNQVFGIADTTSPTAPGSLTATVGAGFVDLDWADSGESDVAGYNVYRSTVAGGSHALLNSTALTTSQFLDLDLDLINGNEYYYVVTALDTSGNESINSLEISATPQGTPSGLRLEAGVVATVGSGTVTVTLANAYDSPVVVTSVNYTNNTVPVVTRVSNVTSTSFNVRLQNPGDLAPVIPESVHYLVVEAGAWTLPDGRAIEAQIVDSTVTDENSRWTGQPQSYLSSYTTPVVLGQVMTENDPEWSTFWCNGGSRTTPPNNSSLRAGKTVCEDPVRARADELLGIIVIEAGTGILAGTQYNGALGNDTVRDVTRSPPYEYALSPSFSSTPAVALITQAAVDGSNGSWAYLYGSAPLTPNRLRLAIDEDQVRDTERRHTTEQVGYLVFQEALVYAE